MRSFIAQHRARQEMKRGERRMIRPMSFLVLILGVLPVSVFAADPSTASAETSPVLSTQSFLAKTASGNQFEIGSSKLALLKSRSERVRTFAAMLVSDHTAAASKLKTAISDSALATPSEILDAEHAAIMKTLDTKGGTAFDRAYVDAQYTAHVETIALFETYAKGGDNDRLRKFASDLLPTLQTHLDHAMKLKQQ
jgi:putative membrane protein